MTSGDKAVSQFGGNVTVSVQYTPKAGEDTNAVVIYYINAEGKAETVSNCKYDPATGTGDGKFSPEAKLTRGQFLVMIMRAYGISADENAKDNFSDAGNTYYTDYLATAKKLGLSAGVGDNKFAPEKEMTRQEMFTLLYNTLKQIGGLPEGTTERTLTSYNDANDIASWAPEAIKQFVATGTISGNGGKLAPTGSATRAETAQILYNLMTQSYEQKRYELRSFPGLFRDFSISNGCSVLSWMI